MRFVWRAICSMPASMNWPTPSISNADGCDLLNSADDSHRLLGDCRFIGHTRRRTDSSFAGIGRTGLDRQGVCLPPPARRVADTSWDHHHCGRAVHRAISRAGSAPAGRTQEMPRRTTPSHLHWRNESGEYPRAPLPTHDLQEMLGQPRAYLGAIRHRHRKIKGVFSLRHSTRRTLPRVCGNLLGSQRSHGR